MITMRRQLLGLGFVAASSLLALNSAHALSGPSAITIDGGPFGSLNLSGGADGYGYGLTGTGTNSVIGNGSNNGAEVGSALIELQKSTGQLQFTIELGSNGGAIGLGATHPGKTSVTNYSTGALYAGYLTVAPSSVPGLTVSAGQIGSLEGWESGVDWNNANQFTTDIWWVQNSQNRGVEASYTTGPFSGTVAFGDGWDDGVWNFVQALGTYTINSDNSVSVYYAGALGRKGLNAITYGDNPERHLWSVVHELANGRRMVRLHRRQPERGSGSAVCLRQDGSHPRNRQADEQLGRSGIRRLQLRHNPVLDRRLG